ncbi:MAG: hypothetical protein PHS15_01195 [Clostridiaceae bacterium]|nr:hypothetical protein [Clostridiaceae bacterium]
MNQEEKHLHKIYQVGGHSFPIYREYYEQMGEGYPAYPDFEASPQYTEEGRPFATAEQGSCPHCRPKAVDGEQPSDCSSCNWFFREHTPYDPIGICMCDAVKQKREK